VYFGGKVTKGIEQHIQWAKSIIFAEQIKSTNSIKVIPVVIFTMLINFIQNEYQFFSFAFLYPLKENQKKADDKTLNVNLNNY
jgi:hypothetical protein